MCQGPLCPNLSQKVQKEVSQMANRKLSSAKNMHEVEGEHSARHSEFRFLNRAIPIFPEESFTLKPGCKRYVKIAAPFPEQLSGVAIVKIVQGAKTITLQLTLQKNLGILDMVNTTNKPMVFCRNNSIGIVDIRSLGFYNIIIIIIITIYSPGFLQCTTNE